jgi:DNA replication ATP-dependent helicase/nuclease Dna2
VEFDVVLFDEASQITLPLAIMGMLVGPKYIFIGDQRQLPPVTMLRASDLARTSIFGYLNGRCYETLLTTTYRMNDVLTAWPSRTFYENAIQPAPGVAERRLTLSGKPSRWDFALDPQHPSVFLDLRHRNTMVRSRKEAEIVAELVLALIRARLPAREIGVVAPYRAQGRLIRNMLREVLPSRELLHDLVVDTVERMQGQEREVVLVSLTTSSPGFAEQLAEFFFQPERLNVAITRPRTKLILVGSRYVLEAEPELPELQVWVDLLRDLVAHCTTFTAPFSHAAPAPAGYDPANPERARCRE